MPKCPICHKWKFSFALRNGVCAACSARMDDFLLQNNTSPATARPAESISASGERTTPAQAVTPAVKKKEPKTYRVTGISHYEDNLMELAIEDDSYSLTKKGLIEEGLIEERVWKYYFGVCKAELVPEPDNPHDPNAIKVIVDGQHVGYIKAGSCAHLLKVIREERIKKISCDIFGGPYKFVEEDYDDERDKEIYTLERGTAPFAVHLTIDEE